MPDHAATEAAILNSGVPHTFLRNATYSEYIGTFSAQSPLDDGAFVYNTGGAEPAALDASVGDVEQLTGHKPISVGEVLTRSLV